MAEAQPKKPAAGDATKERIVNATLETIRSEGIVGTSARAIARTGDFNQALIFYHFGSIDNAVVAAVCELGTKRIAKHQAELENATSLSELIGIARAIHNEDTTSQNITVLAQVFARAARSDADDDLGAQLYAQLEPWNQMLAHAIERVAGDSPLVQFVPMAQLADAMSALFVGIELLDDLDPSQGHADSLFDSMETLAELVNSVLG